jgi:hypothetical protein
LTLLAPRPGSQTRQVGGLWGAVGSQPHQRERGMVLEGVGGGSQWRGAQRLWHTCSTTSSPQPGSGSPSPRFQTPPPRRSFRDPSSVFVSPESDTGPRAARVAGISASWREPRTGPGKGRLRRGGERRECDHRANGKGLCPPPSAIWMNFCCIAVVVMAARPSLLALTERSGPGLGGATRRRD